jgi:hypothetical protein
VTFGLLALYHKITAGSIFLDIVKDCHIEFIDNIKPCQTKAPFQNIFNEKEKEIIDKEIQNLPEIGAIKKAQNCKSNTEYIDMLFLSN